MNLQKDFLSVITSNGLYDDIHKMPILTWQEILSTNNLSLLIKPIEHRFSNRFFIVYLIRKIKMAIHFKITKPLKKKLGLYKAPEFYALDVLWTELQQQYFDEFGVDVEWEMRMNKMKRLALLNFEWVATRNRKLLNDITMLEIELEQWGKEQGIKFNDIADRVSAFRNIQLDLPKMTVVAWYYMIKNISKIKPKKTNVSN